MRIAIIGGSGFIGTRLAKLLAEDEIDFTILDKDPSKLFPGKTVIVDIRDSALLAEKLKGYDVIVNLAAEHRDDVKPVSLYQEVNVVGSENICRAAGKNGINRIIFTSSVAVYGEASAGTSEKDDCHPNNEYGRTKLEAEKVYLDWAANSENNNVGIIRPTVVFGEDNRGNVYNLFRQIAGNRFLFVGRGQNHKAMAYVGNVAAFLYHVILNCRYTDTWNYVDTPIPDMKQLVSLVRSNLGKGKGVGIRIPSFAGRIGGTMFDMLSRLTGRSYPISRVRIEKFMQESSFAAEKASGTGFSPPFSLEESLPMVLKYEFPEG